MYRQKMLTEYNPVHPLPSRIESDRLLLRQFELGDAEEFFELERYSFQGHLSPYSPLREVLVSSEEGIQAMREMLRATNEKWEDGIDHRFAIILKNTNVLIGQIGITNIIRNVAQSAFI